MATRIGVGSILSSYAQSAGWKLINQLVNSKSKFGIFDANGNAFYENSLNKQEISVFDKSISFMSGDKTAEAGVTAFNYSKNYNVTTAPIELGKVMAVNLVEQPRQGQVTYVSTGTEKQRKLFEKALEAAEASNQLYVLHTSELTINHIKIIGHSVNRSASQGTQLVQYQVSFQELLIAPKPSTILQASEYSNDSQNQGVLEVKAVTGNQQQAAMKTP
ncbi:phage baseplate protein [Commensalibacter oyaizuii]|uniref:Dit-like phage tail protein N-terminal domain-containing protein n=1 Tax=Commensalibacter oyaizuii TaxID=3043873 RepID=A0ABT6Q562_9PROT|nr:hypothetical protein [Commensalibacter sp. TBRC 16381]MDI2091691.1 hypothetical protein [Commensalibacter sp. TBRC 16381]